MQQQHDVVPYSQVPSAAVFKALKNETTHAGRVVDNSGSFVKIGHSHAVNLHSRKDAIFRGDMPCLIIKRRVNTSDLRLPDWKIVNHRPRSHV
jgi:hypothetical protein